MCSCVLLSAKGRGPRPPFRCRSRHQAAPADAGLSAVQRSCPCSFPESGWERRAKLGSPGSLHQGWRVPAFASWLGFSSLHGWGVLTATAGANAPRDAFCPAGAREQSGRERHGRRSPACLSGACRCWDRGLQRRRQEGMRVFAATEGPVAPALGPTCV